MSAIFKITNLPIFTMRMKRRKERLANRRIMHKRIIVELDKWVKKNFEKEGQLAYPGKGWEPLKAQTILAKKKGWGDYVATSKGMILHNKGFLKSKWGHNFTKRGASYFSKVEYGPYHHKPSSKSDLPERRILPTEKQFRPTLKKMGLAHIRVALS